MPPRASLTSSFSVTDANNEVVCPLRNQDGSSCRKRCLGEKRFRSMQEHIRRAHPEYYIPKLPATKESFELMISSPPHERPPADNQPGNAHSLHPNHTIHHAHHSHHSSDPTGLSPAFLDPSGAGLSSSFEGGYGLGNHDGGYYTTGDAEAAAIYSNMQAQQRSSDEYIRRGSLIPAASAAQALAQLHHHRPDSSSGGGLHNHLNDGGPGGGWLGPNDIGQVISFPSIQMSPTVTEADFLQNFYADQANHHDLSKTNHFHVDPALEEATFMQPGSGLHDPTSFPASSAAGMDHHPGLLPSSMARSPPPSDRNPTTLPPLQRSMSRSHNRPRKSSLTQQARLAKHERKKSKELAKRGSGGDRKAFSSAEPSAAAILGKRWEDLIDAATSATEEEGSRDLTPIPASPGPGGGYNSPGQVPSRTSLPPFALGSQFQSFQASPLNRALTPPNAGDTTHLPDLQTFPSVESSLSSMSHHHHHDSADSSGSQFQIMNPSSMDSNTTSPLFGPGSGGGAGGAPANAADSAHSGYGGSSNNGIVQIYCSGCRRLSILKESYACTNCICGLCGNCVEAIISGQSRGRMSMCPRCNGMDSSFKPFQLDLR
ncbi:hypothetical protein KC338_g1509 [Hortaea werneckii]|nr:hypothetical protein KC338_g1509 [Hortaea werneckii]KAI6875214.1 hypothetical protein KC323_g416 [Hortaea werneckii]KAI7356685.1 hypothetical protein KC320_g2181 [Hortaea werneckii]